MYSIIVEGRPASHQTKAKEKKKNFQEKVRTQFRFYNPEAIIVDEDLYGIVIYFQKARNKDTDPDADGISKPIWDALEGECYRNDKAIRLRYAGIFTISPDTAQELALDEIDETVADDFIKFLLNQESFVYIHIGTLRSTHYRITL